MNFLRRSTVISLVGLLFVGCGADIPELVALGDAAAERRLAFAQEMAKSLGDFDDLYGKIDVEVKIGQELPAILIRKKEKVDALKVEHGLADAVTNYVLDYPGVYFTLEREGEWMVHLPANVKIEKTASFRLSIP